MQSLFSSIPHGEGATHAHTSSWVAATLRRQIAQGRLRPGTKLSEQTLSEALGVSRNTLREGFTLLDSELIISRIPNRGVFVASPDAADVREIYAVRRSIEPAAIAWGPSLNVAALEAVIGQARAAKTEDSVARMADANQQFHELVVASSGSALISGLMVRVLARMRLVFHTMSDAPNFHPHYVERNASLVQKITAGRRLEAAEDLRRYLDIAESEVLNHLAKP